MNNGKAEGSITVEAAVIVPLILGIIASVFMVLFYYHDKNIVAAVAHETVIMMSETEEGDIEQYFQKRIRKKLLLFSDVYTEASAEKDEIRLVCKAKKKGMALRIEMNSIRTRPEAHIRKVRGLERIKEQIGEEK